MEKEIGFAEYMEKINKRAIEKRKEELIKAKSKVKYWFTVTFFIHFNLYMFCKKINFKS